MGENARRLCDSLTVKIGTCEDMWYLRIDQIGQVAGAKALRGGGQGLRFRFPFPDEDRTLPGEFDNPDRAVGLYDVLPPAVIEHKRVQFASTYPKGHLAMLPCPLSPQGEELGIKFMRNGYAGSVLIKQQKVMGRLRVLVAQCGGCNEAYRLETLEDAKPYIESCRKRGDHETHRDSSRGKWWHAIGDRIEAGYFEADLPPIL
jgi:hypothetical protein